MNLAVKPLFSLWIFKQAMCDYQRVFQCIVKMILGRQIFTKHVFWSWQKKYPQEHNTISCKYNHLDPHS